MKWIGLIDFAVAKADLCAREAVDLATGIIEFGTSTDICMHVKRNTHKPEMINAAGWKNCDH